MVRRSRKLRAEDPLPVQVRAGRRQSLAVIAAFAVIYFVWGSTFLAIKITVTHGDPLTLAALRFCAAGVIVLIWARLRHQPYPSGTELLHSLITASLMFGIGYGCLFWAETRVPSGLAALVLAMIPVWVGGIEIVVFGAPPTIGLLSGLVLGVIGTALLAVPIGELHLHAARGRQSALLVLVFSSMCWSFGTLLQKRLRLPKSLIMSSAVQMLGGGAILAVAAAIHAGSPFVSIPSDRGALAALLYLILAGSVLAFSAYLWLLERVPASKVATYAFVNPVVAVLLGAAIGGERLATREWAGGALILLALVLVLSARSRTAPKREEPG